MGKKIFVSYKYADNNVENLNTIEDSTVRDYVTVFEERLDKSDHIYKGESEGEDLSHLSDDEIWERLKDRIYDSSVTVVFFSPGMRETWNSERNQWIPWEISYSLNEVARKNKNGDPVTSRTNAMVAVVLPDSSGSYSYYLESKNCCNSGCTMHHTKKLFTIIRENKFNRIKNADKRTCISGDTVWHGSCSYIQAVKWCDFIKNYTTYIQSACERQDNIDEYKIEKEIQ